MAITNVPLVRSARRVPPFDTVLAPVWADSCKSGIIVGEVLSSRLPLSWRAIESGAGYSDYWATQPDNIVIPGYDAGDFPNCASCAAATTQPIFGGQLTKYEPFGAGNGVRYQRQSANTQASLNGRAVNIRIFGSLDSISGDVYNRAYFVFLIDCFSGGTTYLLHLSIRRCGCIPGVYKRMDSAEASDWYLARFSVTPNTSCYGGPTAVVWECA